VGFVITAGSRLRVPVSVSPSRVRRLPTLQHGFALASRARGWLVLTARPPRPCRVGFAHSRWPSRTVLALRVTGSVGTRRASPLVSFASPSKTLRIACGPCPCFSDDVLSRGHCRVCSSTSTLSWGSQSSSLRRHTHQESTPTAPPQQAEREGFGRGHPAPRHVPSTPFLTASTACSSWAPWACCSSQPTMGFITFQVGSRISLLSPAWASARPIRIGVPTPSSKLPSRHATRVLDLSSHLPASSSPEGSASTCRRVFPLRAHRLSPACRTRSRGSEPV
jgi:hypothetical protein